jgi:hypothetical protein
VNFDKSLKPTDLTLKFEIKIDNKPQDQYSFDVLKGSLKDKQMILELKLTGKYTGGEIKISNITYDALSSSENQYSYFYDYPIVVKNITWDKNPKNETKKVEPR